MKSWILIGLVVVVFGAATWMMVARRSAPVQRAGVVSDDGGAVTPPATVTLPPRDARVADEPANSRQPEVNGSVPPRAAVVEPKHTPPVPAAHPPAPEVVATPAEARGEKPARVGAAPEPLVPKPVARLALGYVGADPDAEEIWMNAINDPNRPANERQDLIEDLNEDGFHDPKNITEDDLPLIVSRLMLIEELAPDAADDVNAAAFAEADKDLVNMLDRLSRQ
jgi:hypothetical protein